MLLLNRILPLHRMTPHSFGLVLKEQVLCAIQDSWLYTKTFLFLNFLCSKKALEPYGMHQKKKKKSRTGNKYRKCGNGSGSKFNVWVNDQCQISMGPETGSAYEAGSPMFHTLIFMPGVINSLYQHTVAAKQILNPTTINRKAD